MKLRMACVDDAEGIARLATQLGYPTPGETMRTRLSTLLVHSDHHVSVVDDRGQLLGWIAVEHRRTLESGERVEIVGLVVDAGHRGGGVGRMLVEDAEQWARQSGFEAISVRSNIAREASHPFYERLGYMRRKTQHYYVKKLAAPG
jgi:GNAT superfamily N-acetyltransferase